MHIITINSYHRASYVGRLVKTVGSVCYVEKGNKHHVIPKSVIHKTLDSMKEAREYVSSYKAALAAFRDYSF